MGFDSARALDLLGELAHHTAPPASVQEICDRGLSAAAEAVGARSALFLRASGGAAAELAASWGEPFRPDLREAAETAFARCEPVEQVFPDEPVPARVAWPLLVSSETMGAIALERPARWDAAARVFVASAARALAGALQAARTIERCRTQGELLARRNVELEALRELTGRLQELSSEDEMLQAALEVVLKKLGLEAGWIFWGESSRGRLELAAHHGIGSAFVDEARKSGVGRCLCVDVFSTGRLQVARNTVDCPRLPALLCATEQMTHACVPLKFERGILGVLNIANHPGQLFTPQALRFLETVGNQICLAVDKARTARAETRRNAEARALVTLARAIGGSLDQEHVLEVLGRYGCELLSTDRCAIFLGDEPHRLQFAHLTGPALEGLEVGKAADLEQLGSRALVAALRQRRTLVVQNALEDPRANADLARRWRLVSGIFAPLVSHDRLQGLLVAGRSRPSTWSGDEVALADALSRQAAIAIENAGLYREAQENLRKLQEAQYGMMRAERLAAVGTLAASLAHEVRNPLNSINLQLVLLSRRLARLEPEGQDELTRFLETARVEIARLDGLVEEFLSLSSIDRISLREGDPGEPVREVLALMAPIARDRGIKVQEQFSDPLPRVPLDREKLKQVLINLLRNAIEAMPEGGTLGISTRVESGAVVIRVADSGTGIDSGLDVFDFFMTTKRGGTGLGLPIARRIIEAHGGSLTYESAAGQGTVFSVALPVPPPIGVPA